MKKKHLIIIAVLFLTLISGTAVSAVGRGGHQRNTDSTKCHSSQEISSSQNNLCNRNFPYAQDGTCSRDDCPYAQDGTCKNTSGSGRSGSGRRGQCRR